MNYELSCMIVDDEPLAVRLLESYVAKTAGLRLSGSFTDSVEAINAAREQPPQLLFLDVQMPDLNGMELARMLPEGTRVIFTTAFKEYAVESYEVSALDYLLKPILYNKFLAAVEKAFKSEEVTSLFLRVDGEYRRVDIRDIIYVAGKLSTSQMPIYPPSCNSSTRK